MIIKSNFITMQGSVLVFLLFAGVSSEPSESGETVTALPATEDQLKYLTNDVCFVLQEMSTQIELYDLNFLTNCTKNFSSATRDLTLSPSKINITCRSKTVTKFTITPSKHLQLVVVLPNIQDAYIDFFIAKPKRDKGGVYIEDESPTKYTFWSTVLNDQLVPSAWRKGPELPPWSTERLNVTVLGPLLKYEQSESMAHVVNATFELSFTGELTPCMMVEITNTCEKTVLGDFFITKITPTTNQLITIDDIPVNDRCNLSISNNDVLIFSKTYNTTIIETDNTNLYRAVNTFSKEPIEAFFRPEEPKGVTLDEVANGDGWDIRVGWRRPKRDPEVYNLTLRAPGVFRTAIIAGNATGYVFERVRGEPWATYNVSIQAIGNRTSSPLAVPRGRFPEPKDYSSIIITGSWSLILSVATVILGVIVWWKRRKAQAFRHFYFPDPECKLSKECALDFPETVVEDTWELRPERLLLHEVIGEGEFGVVRRGTLAPAGKDVAVKMLKNYPTHEEIRSFRAEMELMKSVGAHPHIVNLVGCCSGRKPLIVAEYCSRGDLLSFLRFSWDVMVSKSNAKYYNNNLEASDYRNDLFKKVQIDKLAPLVVNKMYDLQGICDSELTPLDLLSFCRQIAMGMEFLAANRVVHRDLAARNILVTADRTLKITDFGLSRDVYQENHYKQKGNGKLPVKWMALESLTRGIYTSQSDVWSFGVVMWEILTVGAPPYPEVPAARLPRLLRAGYRMQRPNNCSAQLYEVMLSCWLARARERPTFAQLHRKLDELLNSACADSYLSLELDYEAPPTPKPHRYLKMLLRGNRVWARGESYERPLKVKPYSSPSNHYTSPPAASLAKIQVI